MRISDWSSDVCSADLFRFSRRSLRALTGWGDTQLKVHLGRLADLEYVLIHRMKVGQGYEYELLYDGEGEDGGRFVMGLAAPGQPYDAERSVPEGARSPHGRGLVGARSENGRAGESAAKPQPASLCGASADDVSETSLSRLNGGHEGSGAS